MSSSVVSLTGQSASIVVEERPGRSFLLSEFQRQLLVDPVVGDSEAPLDRAVAAMGRAQREIDRLWHDSMTAGNSALSARLLDVSHALHRAACSFGQEPTIG